MQESSRWGSRFCSRVPLHGTCVCKRKVAQTSGHATRWVTDRKPTRSYANVEHVTIVARDVVKSNHLCKGLTGCAPYSRSLGGGYSPDPNITNHLGSVGISNNCTPTVWSTNLMLRNGSSWHGRTKGVWRGWMGSCKKTGQFSYRTNTTCGCDRDPSTTT